MYNVSFLTISIVIIVIIIFIIIISSLSYDDKYTTVEEVKSKSLTGIFATDYSKTTIKPSQKFRSCYFDTILINKNITYILNGNFYQTCVSLYDITDDKEERIFSRVFDGSYSILFGSNLNIISPLIKGNKNKSSLIPLKLDKKYRIVFNNSNDINIQKYLVNYDISYKEIVYDYPKSLGLNEYDLELHFRQNIINENIYESDIERLQPKNPNSHNIWEINSIGKHAVVLVKNLYNIKINDEVYTKNNKLPEIEIKYLDDIDFKIFNLDYIENKKDINTEYIDFITSPKYLVDKFLYGSDSKKINYSYFIGDKVLIYKLK